MIATDNTLRLTRGVLLPLEAAERSQRERVLLDQLVWETLPWYRKLWRVITLRVPEGL